MFKIWPELSLLDLSELLQTYMREDVCCTREAFAVALNGLHVVKIIGIHLLRP